MRVLGSRLEGDLFVERLGSSENGDFGFLFGRKGVFPWFV